MYWIDSFRLAEIHRETYVAILKSWVPHGKREEFARRCGIAREYLSCLCALDSQFDGIAPVHKRYPSPEIAAKIAEALPAPVEIKRSLIESMELARVHAVKARQSSTKKIDRQSLLERISDIGKMHGEATFGKDLTQVQRAYVIVRDAAKTLIEQVSPEKHPDSFAQACLYYHDAQCVLNRPDEALLYAKIAQLVLKSIEEIESSYTQEQRDNFEINAIRGEAVAYHNLSLDRMVPDILERACHTSAYRNNNLFWEPHVKRDLINAMVEIPRFGIREINKITRQIQSDCERTGDELTLLLAHESWLRSLIRRERIDIAQYIFREEIERLTHLAQLGALHRAMLYKSGADLFWKLPDMEAWKTHATQAVRLMHLAGLKHQFYLIKHTYMSALDPVLEELELPPV